MKKSNSKKVPDHHYVIDVSKSVFQKDDGKDPMNDFLPKSPTKRKTMHKKVNECDY